jgi:hypothetical protein
MAIVGSLFFIAALLIGLGVVVRSLGENRQRIVDALLGDARLDLAGKAGLPLAVAKRRARTLRAPVTSRSRMTLSLAA